MELVEIDQGSELSYTDSDEEEQPTLGMAKMKSDARRKTIS